MGKMCDTSPPVLSPLVGACYELNWKDEFLCCKGFYMIKAVTVGTWVMHSLDAVQLPYRSIVLVTCQDTDRGHLRVSSGILSIYADWMWCSEPAQNQSGKSNNMWAWYGSFWKQ